MTGKRVILVANTSWFLYNYRLSFARALQHAGYNVLCCAPEDRYSSKLEEAGFRWQPLNLGRQSLAPWKELASLRSLMQIYRGERPAIAHHFTIKPVIYGSLAARWVRVPMVVNDITGRGYIFQARGVRGQILSRLGQVLYRQAFRHPNHALVFENEVDREDFETRSLLTTTHVHLIEGAGVDTDYFIPPPSREPTETPLAVLPARLLWEKGVGVLVDAVRLLPKETRLRVALVGEPDPGNPGAIDVGTLEAWHAAGPVEWWGFRQDIRQVYWESDMVVLPTMYNEGVPTALMEAAACGLPLVATDNPGCRSVVANNHNGFLVPPNNPEALANALDKLAKNPTLRDRMGAAGRAWALERFTHRKINAQRLAVYEALSAAG